MLTKGLNRSNLGNKHSSTRSVDLFRCVIRSCTNAFSLGNLSISFAGEANAILQIGCEPKITTRKLDTG